MQNQVYIVILAWITLKKKKLYPLKKKIINVIKEKSQSYKIYTH